MIMLLAKNMLKPWLLKHNYHIPSYSLFRGDVTSSINNESAIFRRWKSSLKWRMFHASMTREIIRWPKYPDARKRDYYDIVGNSTTGHLCQTKIMCVYCHMSKKSRVGRSGLLFFLLLLSAKLEIVVSGIRFRYFIFEIFGKASFIEAVLWRIMQFFFLLCSQFRQKASGWINKTLLLIKQQKWLSEFCVKIHRVASKH